MTFIIPISIEPGEPQIKKGDTLWIRGNFPDTLLEIHSGGSYRLPNFNFKSKVCIHRIIDSSKYLSEQTPAIEEFGMVNQVGGISNLGTLCGDLSFVFNNGKYYYEIGLIPEHLGTYFLFFLYPIDLHNLPEEQIDLRPVINLGKTPKLAERIPVYEAFYFVVNNGDTNFEVFSDTYRATSLEIPLSLSSIYTEQKTSFSFRVVD